MKKLICLLIFFFFLTDSSSSCGRENFSHREESNAILYRSASPAERSIKNYPDCISEKYNDINYEFEIKDESYSIPVRIFDFKSSENSFGKKITEHFNNYAGHSSWSENFDTTASKSDADDYNKQSFAFGIRYELFFMFLRTAISGNTVKAGGGILNFHYTFGLGFPDNYRIYLQFGYSYVNEDFYGADFGIFLQANLYKGIYGVLGVDFFNNSGFAHGVSVSYDKSFILYCVGAGYQISKHFIMDLTFSIPNDKVFGYDYDYNSSNEYVKVNKINNGFLTLGFEYIFR